MDKLVCPCVTTQAKDRSLTPIFMPFNECRVAETFRPPFSFNGRLKPSATYTVQF